MPEVKLDVFKTNLKWMQENLQYLLIKPVHQECNIRY